MTDVVIEAVEGFDWDAGNAEKNRRRHRVTQTECEQVFASLPFVLPVPAKASVVESRYFSLGRTDAARELTIVFRVRSEKLRLISARSMSRCESREYSHAKVRAASEEDDS